MFESAQVLECVHTAVTHCVAGQYNYTRPALLLEASYSTYFRQLSPLPVRMSLAATVALQILLAEVLPAKSKKTEGVRHAKGRRLYKAITIRLHGQVWRAVQGSRP